jgi:tetratricopeptide (TPR) repeat protein
MRPRTIAAAAFLCLPTICTAADGVQAQEWSATMKCGAIASAPDKWPPFSWSVPLVVADGKASITRDTARVQETLSGTVSPDGAVVMDGGGSFKEEQSGRPWRWRLEGRFTADKLESAGAQLTADGSKKIRECSLVATRHKQEAEVKASVGEPEAGGQISAQKRRELIQFYQRSFRPEEAIPHLQQELAEVMQRGPDSAAEAGARLTLGKQLRAANRYQEAVEHVTAAQRIYQREFGPDDARTLDAAVMVGWMQVNVGQSQEGITTLEDAIRRGQAKFGRNHRPTAWANVPLAAGYRNVGRLADAERVLLEALKFFERDNETSTDYAAVLGDLSGVYQLMGKLNEAEQYAQQSLTVYLNRAGPQWPTTIARMRGLAEILLDQRRAQEALKISERAVAYAEQYHASISA